MRERRKEERMKCKKKKKKKKKKNGKEGKERSVQCCGGMMSVITKMTQIGGKNTRKEGRKEWNFSLVQMIFLLANHFKNKTKKKDHKEMVKVMSEAPRTRCVCVCVCVCLERAENEC